MKSQARADRWIRGGLAILTAALVACGTLQGDAPGGHGVDGGATYNDARITASDAGTGVDARPTAGDTTQLDHTPDAQFLVP